MKVTQLSVIGYLNNEDIGLLKKMAGQTKETDSEVTGSLKSLNLSEATFTETGKIVPESIFQNCKNLAACRPQQHDRDRKVGVQ